MARNFIEVPNDRDIKRVTYSVIEGSGGIVSLERLRDELTRRFNYDPLNIVSEEWARKSALESPEFDFYSINDQNQIDFREQFLI
tara:strand:- start:27 stop:281 length:255 start_codon:yes stop_codon:yes gene_type:complete